MNERYDMDEKLRRALGDLPTSIEPDRDLWPDIEDRLGTDVDDGVHAAPEAPARRYNPWRLAWPIAAVLAFALVSNRLLDPASTLPSEFDQLALGYEQVSDDTRATLSQGDTQLADDERAVLEENLSLLDAAIAETRTALEGAARAPGQALRLTAGFQKKIDLLERLAGRASRY